MTGPEIAMRMRIATAAAINLMAHSIGGEAQREAPVEEGTLRGTMAVEEATPLDLEATISFSTPYAARQHEELDWKHPKGGKAKYLEDPMKAATPTAEKVLGATIKKALELSLRGL